MKNVLYQREKVVSYAKTWAYLRNPNYYNFDPVGGDCTSFASQCVFAGSNVMNYAKENGWYYINGNQKSPSWSGVEFFYDFLVNNRGIGPYGKEVDKQEVEIGDIAQLSFTGNQFEHTLVIVKTQKPLDFQRIKIASHTYDSFDKSIQEYHFQKIRFIHIEGVRK